MKNKERLMALAYNHPKMSLEEFFQLIEKNPEIRYEYLGGYISMMTGGTARHALIGSNLNHILRTHLEGIR
jgi:Uma2 family endonuclease